MVLIKNKKFAVLDFNQLRYNFVENSSFPAQGVVEKSSQFGNIICIHECEKILKGWRSVFIGSNLKEKIDKLEINNGNSRLICYSDVNL